MASEMTADRLRAIAHGLWVLGPVANQHGVPALGFSADLIAWADELDAESPPDNPTLPLPFDS